jgi:lipoate-protein ligase A
MARDEALARACRLDTAVLRLYGWVRPTVSFGRNEPATALYRVEDLPDPDEACQAAGDSPIGLDFVRRPTGGRAVLHDAEVTYTVVAPFEALGGAREGYRRINAALAEGLRSLGAAVEIADAPRGRGAPVDAGPCFRLPAPGEVTARGRKLVGSAQVRIGRTLLQHGSVILRGDQSRLAALHARMTSEADVPAALEDLIGSVDPAAVGDALVASVVAAFGGRGRNASYTREEEELAERLMEERYGRPEWTWRR